MDKELKWYATLNSIELIGTRSSTQQGTFNSLTSRYNLEDKSMREVEELGFKIKKDRT